MHPTFSRRASLFTCAALLSSIAFLLPAIMHGAKAESPSPSELKTPADFKGDEARQQLSGAACAKTDPPLSSCIVVNDQKKYAQFFSVVGDTIVPGAVIKLSDAEDDPDLELQHTIPARTISISRVRTAAVAALPSLLRVRIISPATSYSASR